MIGFSIVLCKSTFRSNPLYLCYPLPKYIPDNRQQMKCNIPIKYFGTKLYLSHNIFFIGIIRFFNKKCIYIHTNQKNYIFHLTLFSDNLNLLNKSILLSFLTYFKMIFCYETMLYPYSLSFLSYLKTHFQSSKFQYISRENFCLC